jgi:hypothetical protein
MLPDIKGFSLDTKKGIIQSFLTIHYSKPDHRTLPPLFDAPLPTTGICCAKVKVLVPWSDIIKGQSRFISSSYLPDNANIMDPSKMHQDEANALLECWLD